MKDIQYTIIAAITLLLANTPASAQTWVAVGAPAAGVQSIACSADGLRVVAAVGQDTIYLSTNGGTNWTPTSAPVLPWSLVVSSVDGMKLAAATDNHGGPPAIYTSTNGGSNWDQTPFPGQDTVISLAGSADGNVLVALGTFGQLPPCISTNWGQTWSTAGGGFYLCLGICVSSNGTHMAAAGYTTVYVSSDTGQTWTPTGIPAYRWHGVASSWDGSKILALGEAGIYDPSLNSSAVYLSSDWGSNWVATGGGVITNVSPPYDAFYAPYLCAASADASHLLAASDGGPIYVSTNGGTNWSATIVPGAFPRVAVSADGTRSFTTAQHRQVYVLQPGPPLSVGFVLGNLLLACPDYLFTRYGLLESTNVSSTNWTAVTDTPVYTNGMAQFLLTPSGDNHFFRIASP